jgi:hypothetical protein
MFSHQISKECKLKSWYIIISYHVKKKTLKYFLFIAWTYRVKEKVQEYKFEETGIMN